MWRDRKILDLFGIKTPIIQAPMAGAAGSALAIAVSKAGGLGSIACPMLSLEQIKKEVDIFKESCPGSPLNLNFFCHEDLPLTAEAESVWKNELKRYYDEFGIDINQKVSTVERRPFNEETCSLVEELKPEIISFHFGLPSNDLMKRVKVIGSKIISSATTVEEAIWLEEKGCDAIIAQGFEAGGHRAIFLKNDISTQIGTAALVPLIRDAIKLPVIASGGISDARGIVAALNLGASAVQIGTAYLFTPEATISSIHRAALNSEAAQETALTNIFSGRPARGVMNRIMREIGPMTKKAPPFPHAVIALAPLKHFTEKQGSPDFMSLWAGQAAGLCRRDLNAYELTKELEKEALSLL